MLTLAQTEAWWELVPVQITLWATALAALIYLIRKLFGGAEFLRRLGLAMLEMGVREEWPNGATTIGTSLTEIYRRQGETHELVQDVQKELTHHIREFEEHVSMHRHG